jgi:uncharacterized repeat protein (TIGR03803 family)
MKTKLIVFAITMMLASFARECQAQSNPCGAANFTFYGNYQNQQVRLYFIGVDGNLYNNLVNNLQGNYADPQAAYLYNALTSPNAPIGIVVAQVVMTNGIPQDGPNTFLPPNSPELQQLLNNALLWGYNSYNNVNLGFTNTLATDLAAWQWEDGIDSNPIVYGTFDFAQYFGDIDGLVDDFVSDALDTDSASKVGDFATTIYDSLQGYASFQATNSTRAAAVLNILTNNGVIPDSNYTAPQLITGLANLTPQQLSVVETQLETAVGIDSQSIPTNAQEYIDTFIKSLLAGGVGNAKSLAVGSISAGGYAGYTAYFAAQSLGAQSAGGIALSAGTSAASDYVASAAPPLAVLWVGNAVFDTLVTPQLALQQDEFKIVHTLTIVCPEVISIATNMTASGGLPNFSAGTAFMADLGILNSLQAADGQVSYSLGAIGTGLLSAGQQTLSATLGLWTNAVTLAQTLANNSSQTPIPVINKLSQVDGVLGDEFTISGSNFCNVVAIYFNNAPAWFQVNSFTNISTVTPAGTNTVDIRIVGPGGVSLITANDKFTYGAVSSSPTNKVISLTGNLAFGNVTVETSAQRTLAIGNTGNTNLTVSSISYPSGFNGSWAGMIPPGGSTNVTVTFSPTLATSYGGNVTVNSDKTSGNNVISASGTGVNASSGGTRIIDVVPESDLNFGNVQVNTTATRIITIVSEGNTNLDITNISYTTQGFSGNWSGTILHGNQVVIAINFSPTALINYSGSMTVNSDKTSGTDTLPISGTGVSPPPPPTNRIPVSAFETLHPFADSDGNNPYAPLVQGNDGGFYGTTYRGGTRGVGSIFRIGADGTFLSLYSFTNQNNVVGFNPRAGLVQGTDGNFYSTASDGGTNLAGTVFRSTPYGTVTLLVTFNGVNGDAPYGGLVQGSDGNFYGTTEAGGTDGTIFQITPNGVLSTLYAFKGTDGALPAAGLLEASDSNFYGTTLLGGTNGGNGTIFRITPDGTFTSLFSFSGTNGSAPWDSLIEGNDGNFYGTTYGGGIWNSGTVFRITPSGTLTPLYSFTGGCDGYGPLGALVQATDGNFYGTASKGGTNGNGTIFRITPNGAFVILHMFLGGNEGYKPMAAMVQGQDGNLYGTTANGGMATSSNTNRGTIFRLVIPPMIQPIAQTGGAITLTWSSIVGQTYQVQCNSDLNSTNWINLTPLITPTSSRTMVSDTISVNQQQRYYRIVEFPEAW